MASACDAYFRLHVYGDAHFKLNTALFCGGTHLDSKGLSSSEGFAKRNLAQHLHHSFCTHSKPSNLGIISLNVNLASQVFLLP